MNALEESMENMTKRFDTMTRQLKFVTQQSDDRFARLFQSMVPAQRGRQDGSADSALGPTTPKVSDVKGHGCRAPPCSRSQETCKANGNCCSDMMFEMLLDFSGYLARRNVTHFLLAGTLLGAVRDQDIIPYTADIDMVIPREGWEKAMQINEERDVPRSYYFQQDPEEPHCARLCPVWRDLPVNRRNFAEHFDWDVEQLSPDVPFYMDIYDEDMDFNQKLKHLFYPLSNVTIRNHTFPAPRESQIWVEARYGANWKTPDHNSREVGEAGYPTLDQAEDWSKNAVLLERVLRSPSASLRMLKHARLSHKSQQMYVEVADLEGASLAHLKVQSVEVKGLKTSSDGAVLEGALLVAPPADGQGDVTGLAMYWAAERIVDWDAQLEKLGQAVRLERPAGAFGAGQPDAAHPWQVPLPRTLVQPPNATYVALACVTEEGESADFVLAPLDPSLAAEGSADAEAVDFTETVSFGLMKVLHSGDSAIIVPCIRGRFVLRSADVDEVINIMIRKTPDDMRRALAKFAGWLSPIAQSLQKCRDERAHPIGGELESLLSHLSAPKQFEYTPGKQLDVDGKSLFLGINSLIGAFRRKEVSSFASFLGALLLLFGPPAPGSGPLTTQDPRSPGALPPAPPPPPADVQVAAEAGAGAAAAEQSAGGGRARTLLSGGR